jgi:uncharacterized protein with HEPN domain
VTSNSIAARYGAKAGRTLRDMIDFGEMAADLVRRGRGAYDADILLRLAGEAIAHKFGEAAARLPDDLKSDNPQIPFRPVTSMRNLIAHDYNRIDHEVLWTTLSIDVPVLIEQIGTLLR